MDITWKHNVIGGETVAGDFIAEAEGEIIGRVMQISGGPQNGKWQWSFLLGHSDFRYGHLSCVEDGNRRPTESRPRSRTIWNIRPTRAGVPD